MAKFGVMPSTAGHNVASAHAASACPTIVRLETALDRLEQLLLEREAELHRLRRVQAVAIETLAELDEILDDEFATGGSLIAGHDPMPCPAAVRGRGPQRKTAAA